jgi:hypothetical protein
MDDFIRDMLEIKGPCLTSELVADMLGMGISATAARQRISRSKAAYIRLGGIKFNRNTGFIYLDGQYGTDEFWKALERAFQSHGQAYWSTIVALNARGRRYPENLFPIVCGAPERRKGQLPPSIILERLMSVNYLEREETEAGQVNLVKFKPMIYPPEPEERMRALLIAENVALNAIKNWARGLGWGSYGAFRLRGEERLPDVAGVSWDLSAPSYLRPLVQKHNEKIKPGFFVSDIYLGQTIELQVVEQFIRKYDMAASPINVAPIMAMLVGNEFTNKAFDRAKSAGIIPATIKNLFGKNIEKALADLIKLLSDTGATAAVNPEHLEAVINKLTSIEGASNNLRAALFELVIASLVKDLNGGYVKTAQKKKDHPSGRKAEIDVLWHDKDSKKVLVVECKAKIPGSEVSSGDIERWYTDRVPLIHKILQAETTYQDCEFVFEIWTNGVFHSSAERWLSTKPKQLDDYKVGWRNGRALKLLADQANSQHIKSILKEHYFNNPGTVLYPN